MTSVLVEFFGRNGEARQVKSTLTQAMLYNGLLDVSLHWLTNISSITLISLEPFTI